MKTTLTIEDVQAAILAINNDVAIGDDEAAHSKEDALHERFIQYVATRPNIFHAAKLAKEILKTKEIEFSRWCA